MSSSVDPDGYGVKTKKSVIGWLTKTDPQESPATQQKHQLYRRIFFASVILITIAVLVLLGCLAYFFLFQSGSEISERPYNNQTFRDPIENNDTVSEHDSWTATQLQKYMNLSVSPCEDFYHFSCGGWLNHKDVQRMTKKVSLTSVMKETLYKDLIKLLRQLPIERDPPYRLQPKRYFVACSNTGRLEQLGLKPFLDFLKSLGKFPLLESSWNKGDFWITTTTAKMTTLDINHLFKFLARPEQKNSTRFLVTKPDFPMIEQESVLKWMQYNLRQLGVNTDDQNYTSAVSKIFEYEKVLQQYATNSNDNIKVYSDVQLKKIEKLIDWSYYLKMIGINAQVPQIATKHLYYFENMLNISQDSKTTANFFLKRLLNLTLCLGPRFKPLEAFMSPHTEHDWQRVCVDLTRKTLPAQLARLYVDEVYRLQSDSFVNEMVTLMKDVISNKTSENVILDQSAGSTAFSEINLIHIKTGLMDYLQDTQALNKVFIMESNSEFFESHLSFLKFKFNQSLFAEEDTHSWLKQHTPLDLDVDYQPTEHFLTIPAALLQPPLINSTWPSSMKYGGIGTYLGRVLANIYLKILFNVSKPPSDEEREARQCFVSQYSKYVFDGYQISGEIGVIENILDYEGLTVAYEAFDSHWSGAGKHEQALPGLNLSHDQLFFLVYAQTYCQHIPTDMSEAEVTEGRLPNKIRVNGSLKNSKHFAAAYKCKSGSPMNPVNKCKFI